MAESKLDWRRPNNMNRRQPVEMTGLAGNLMGSYDAVVSPSASTEIGRRDWHSYRNSFGGPYQQKDPLQMTGIAGVRPGEVDAATNYHGARRGVGTTNPNAYAVGAGSRGPTYYLERAARRGNRRAAEALAGMSVQQQENAADREFRMELERERQGALDARQDEMLDRREASEREFFDLETARRQSEFEQQGTLERQRDRRNRRRDQVEGIEMMPLPPTMEGGQSAGSLPMLRRADGSMSPIGGGPVMNPRAPQVGTIQMPDGTAMATIDGEPQPGLGRYQAREMAGPTRPGQVAPQQVTRVDEPMMEAPTIQEIPDPANPGVKMAVQWNPTSGRWERVRAVDVDGDGVPDPVPAAGQQTPVKTTAGGNSYRRRN